MILKRSKPAGPGGAIARYPIYSGTQRASERQADEDQPSDVGPNWAVIILFGLACLMPVGICILLTLRSA